MIPPNEQRNFFHRRIAAAVGGFLTGGPVGAAAGLVTGGGRPSSRSGGSPGGGRRANLVAPGRCPPGRRRIGRRCVRIRAALPGGVPFTTPLQATGGGEATMGQFGAGLTPLTDTRTIRNCLPGMVLGSDGLCYNRHDIRNSDREWPRGTRPLGTPGEMAALRKAAAFGRRMEGAVKRMQKIGVLKKPRRAHATRPRAAQKLLGAGPGVSVVNVE